MSDPVATGSTPTEPSATPAAETTAPVNPAPEAKPAEPAVQDPNAQPAEKPAEAKPDDKPVEKTGAPEAYEEFKLPEGYSLDEELGGSLKEAAKEMNLTQEQAQKLADLGAKQAQKFQEQQATAIEKARGEWAESAKTDKEFGGDKFGDNLAVAKKAMEAYASPELKTLLNQTGLGSHPEFIRLMWKAGQAISEDRFDTGRSANASAPSKTAADRLYGNKQPGAK